jgi:hypothetical protein
VDASDRQAEWSRFLDTVAVNRTPVSGGVRVKLLPLQGVRAELDRLVEAERECCPFLDFVVDENDAGVTLTVTAPPQAEPIVQGLLG